jgi:hypothetical protein
MNDSVRESGGVNSQMPRGGACMCAAPPRRLSTRQRPTQNFIELLSETARPRPDR